MAWTITERFPSWGETGEFPADGFFYEGGDQVNEKHLDALWNGVDGLEEDVQAALDDIDSNADGVVDKADSGAAGFTFDGGATLSGDLTLGNDLLATGGEVIWDESNGWIPQARLENDTVTVTAGDGLKGGGGVSLGTSTTLNVEPADFAGDGVKDDGSDNIAIEPADFAGTYLSDDGADNLTVDLGSHLENDGSGNIRVADDFVENTGDSMSGNIDMNINDVLNVAILGFDQGGSINDTTNGALQFDTSGGTRAELDDGGNFDIEGALTEGAAL